MPTHAPLCHAARRAFQAVATGLLLAFTVPADAEEAGSALPERAALVATIRQAALPLRGAPGDYDPLLTLVGEARLVLLGEATHGSAEFYRERWRITRRLIEEKGYDTLILEAGWTPVVRLNDYIHGRSADRGATQALADFRRFPRWTWRNVETAQFLDWLRAYNAALPPGRTAISLYGMDLYGVPEAAAAVVRYLRAVDPPAAARAQRRYRCFAPYRRIAVDPQYYGRDVARGWMPSCEAQVKRQYQEMRRMAERRGDEASFTALHHARAAMNGEAYYRLLYGPDGSVPSWNRRERHLAESVELLLARHAKAVVWAHNTHQGDARATDQLAAGELSLGQLARERYGAADVVLVGFSTYAGTVRAATGWATRDRIEALRPALAESWPALLHDSGVARFLLDLRGNPELAQALDHPRPDRAIGVNYLPDSERESHYHSVRLPRRFDALIHLDTSSALTVLP